MKKAQLYSPCEGLQTKKYSKRRSFDMGKAIMEIQSEMEGSEIDR